MYERLAIYIMTYRECLVIGIIIYIDGFADIVPRQFAVKRSHTHQKSMHMRMQELAQSKTEVLRDA